MSEKLFKPNHFGMSKYAMWKYEDVEKDLAEICNSRLELAGIQGFAQKHRGTWTFTERQMKGDTHRALLLNLEELSPCVHEKEKVTTIGRMVTLGDKPVVQEAGFRCECGAEVEPAGFVEVKK